ncbi:hypothetical protein BDR03DRAFT_943298 [Suillus americanus]|nr:hypothetical protein BDR03DRAFT_943298 [Suillus americanus]
MKAGQVVLPKCSYVCSMYLRDLLTPKGLLLYISLTNQQHRLISVAGWSLLILLVVECTIFESSPCKDVLSWCLKK